MSSNDGDFMPVWIHLDSSLDTYDEEHERFYAAPASTEEERLHRALDDVSKHALEALQGGAVPQTLQDALIEYQPWEALDQRVFGLLGFTYVRKRVQLDVAREVVHRLYGLDGRVNVATFAFMLLQRANPAPTAFKYLRQALRLYLAGYTSEVFIMCGAVLEAAIAERFPDSTLIRAGEKPKNRHTGTFAIGQRMKAELGAPIMSPSQRVRFWTVVNWRNDVAHVQVDIGPDPALAVLEVASLLGTILPRDAG